MLLSPVDLFWKAVAKVVSRPRIAEWIIQRSFKTPYFHLEGYMDRWWVFNPYGGRKDDPTADEATRHNAEYPWLPSIRVHHILREDHARDMHDHPWDARTIILRGSYIEERMKWMGHRDDVIEYHRKAGDTATLNFGEFHNITSVSKGGVWTLFFTWKWHGDWGFFVNGRKVPWQQYSDHRQPAGDCVRYTPEQYFVRGPIPAVHAGRA